MTAGTAASVLAFDGFRQVNPCQVGERGQPGERIRELAKSLFVRAAAQGFGQFADFCGKPQECAIDSASLVFVKVKLADDLLKFRQCHGGCRRWCHAGATQESGVGDRPRGLACRGEAVRMRVGRRCVNVSCGITICGEVQQVSDFTTVAKVGDIPPGEGRAYPVRDRMVAVFNEGGTHSAIDDFCPHMGASLAGGYVENGKVACPWHAWRFCVKDGTWCDNPRIKIDAFEVRIEGDEIQVLVPEKKTPASTNS